MSFIVEDGTAKVDATSYVSLDYADTYHTQYSTSWPVTPDPEDELYASIIAQKQLALNLATRAVDLLYGDDFKSYPFTQEQSLEFPRYAFYLNARQICNSNEIPRALKDAVCELALMQVLGQDIEPDVAEASLVSELSESVDTISRSVKYAGTLTDEKYQGMLKIERILKSILMKPEQFTRLAM